MNPRKILLNARAYSSWRLLDRPGGKRLVRVVGDSHTKAFFGARGFYVHHIGAATAYNLCEAGSSTRSREKVMAVVGRMDPDHEILMLSFGEVDCRIHIFGQFMRRKETVSIAELIAATVERYGRALVGLRDRGIRIVVYGIIAATHQPNRYKVKHYAPPEVHVRIYQEFNTRLRAFCEGNGFPYIDVQAVTSDVNGFIAPEFVHGDAHLNRKVVPLVRRILVEAGVWPLE